ncbi:MAG: M28 family peptidase, partial [Bdellovibrionia bacterium]
LTFVGSKAGEGYFSPDGKKMIFQSERHPGNPFYQMYIMDLETGKTRLVSPGNGKTTCGWIHPDMNKILFSSTHLDPQVAQKTQAEIESRKNPVKGRYSWSFDEYYDIFSSNMEGKSLKRLTKELGYDAEASYSPDGKWIAFASNRNGYAQKLNEEDAKLFAQDPSYMMDIYIMKSDGSAVKQLTDSKGYDGGPFFSADGKKITWRRFSANGSTAEIFTMNVDGTEQTQVTHLKSMSWAPYFHPSGDYLIFGSSVFGYSNFELFIVDAKGTKKPVRVTFNDGFDGLPVFTPDGLNLSWTHRNEKGDSQILMASWNDTLARKLLGLPVSEPKMDSFSHEVKEQEIESLVRFLSSEDMAGRKTGSPEEKRLADFYAKSFKQWGLVGAGPKGSFFHEFEYTSGVQLGAKNAFEGVGGIIKKWKVGVDYLPLSFSKTGEFVGAPVVFAGYGLVVPGTEKIPAYDSYKDLDVKGKWALVFQDIPQEITPELRQHYNTYSRIQHKVTVAKNAGAIGLILVQGPLSGYKEDLKTLKYEGALSESSIAVLKLSAAAAQEILNKSGTKLESLQKDLDKEFKPGFVIPSTYLQANVDLNFTKAKGVNVLAMLPVKGAQKGVMIGAHGDHLGTGEMSSSLATGDEKGKIHYGADDNASGVAGLLEMAHYYSQTHKKNPKYLKQNLYFSIWSGEEVGILGSTALVKDWKSLHKKDIKDHVSAYINMDMIGRLRDKLFVQGLGSGDNWQPLVEEMGVRSGLALSLGSDPYLPTDAMALYMGEIPVMHLFTGAHGEYHTPRDTADLINYKGIARVVEFATLTVNTLADNRQNLVKYVKVGSGQKQMEGRSFRIFLGTIPDYSQDGVKGVRVSGASKDSPAEKAGVKAQDIIIEFDGTKIENLYDYVYTLQSVKPNKETILKVNRAGAVVELKIVPKLKE